MTVRDGGGPLILITMKRMTQCAPHNLSFGEELKWVKIRKKMHALIIVLPLRINWVNIGRVHASTMPYKKDKLGPVLFKERTSKTLAL